MDPVTIALLAGGGMALGGLLGGKKKKAPTFRYSPEAQEFQSDIYSTYDTALTGGGMFPTLSRKAFEDRLYGLRDELTDIRSDLPGLLNRFIPKEDVKVRSQIESGVESTYARGEQDILRQRMLEGEMEIGPAISGAMGYLGAAGGVGAQTSQMGQAAQMQSAMSPTFGTQLAGGLGGAAGWIGGQPPGTQAQPYLGLNIVPEFFRAWKQQPKGGF